MRGGHQLIGLRGLQQRGQLHPRSAGGLPTSDTAYISFTPASSLGNNSRSSMRATGRGGGPRDPVRRQWKRNCSEVSSRRVSSSLSTNTTLTPTPRRAWANVRWAAIAGGKPAKPAAALPARSGRRTQTATPTAPPPRALKGSSRESRSPLRRRYRVRPAPLVRHGGLK